MYSRIPGLWHVFLLCTYHPISWFKWCIRLNSRAWPNLTNARRDSFFPLLHSYYFVISRCWMTPCLLETTGNLCNLLCLYTFAVSISCHWINKSLAPSLRPLQTKYFLISHFFCLASHENMTHWFQIDQLIHKSCP